MKKIHPTVAEAVDPLDLGTATRRRLLSGAGLVSASLAASALLTACGDDTPAAGAVGNFPKTPKWKFVFVCHVTTNPFFTPTQYGAEDARKFLGADYLWTGHVHSVVARTVSETLAVTLMIIITICCRRTSLERALRHEVAISLHRVAGTVAEGLRSKGH